MTISFKFLLDFNYSSCQAESQIIAESQAGQNERAEWMNGGDVAECSIVHEEMVLVRKIKRSWLGGAVGKPSITN
ncbi:hypothetical protein NPIL_453031 [Nephila pilipes]|uniref:Uncharacterized protein n=1 Tax=Nephila pilipes TaxID=299642 RepID=A0A8X6TQ19_NEPPI|nr:hypothetical protein NPIL_453031 [Nephila pilipes]